MSFVTQSEMKLSIMPERTSTFCQKIIMIHVQYVHCTVYSITAIISKYKCGKIYLKICHLCTVEL